MNIKGIDDQGNFYSNLSELHSIQEANKIAWYEANSIWWESGYGGCNDDEAMIGDSDGEADALAGLSFLDMILNRRPLLRIRSALDCGAGVGRITKFVLSRRCQGTVTLLEENKHWSERSRAYLGRKRASTCNFVNQRMESLDQLFPPKSMDIIWFQWCLQYLTDMDVIRILTLAGNILTDHGIIIIKENKPTVSTTGSSRLDRFQMDTPLGPEGRFDITRPNEHHKYLFKAAELRVIEWLDGEETITVALDKEH